MTFRRRVKSSRIENISRTTSSAISNNDFDIGTSKSARIFDSPDSEKKLKNESETLPLKSKHSFEFITKSPNRTGSPLYKRKLNPKPSQTLDQSNLEKEMKGDNQDFATMVKSKQEKNTALSKASKKIYFFYIFLL